MCKCVGERWQRHNQRPKRHFSLNIWTLIWFCVCLSGQKCEWWSFIYDAFTAISKCGKKWHEAYPCADIVSDLFLLWKALKQFLVEKITIKSYFFLSIFVHIIYEELKNKYSHVLLDSIYFSRKKNMVKLLTVRNFVRI